MFAECKKIISILTITTQYYTECGLRLFRNFNYLPNLSYGQGLNNSFSYPFELENKLFKFLSLTLVQIIPRSFIERCVNITPISRNVGK